MAICLQRATPTLLRRRWECDRARETTVQYLVINALETLELIELRIFDSETGNYYIRTPSPVLPVAH
ncbi:hypothetical protein [Argonema antarcticum]|uniref:hypothetical protein n=1 Tax=Argonema antarcticum TaxID=2942763 RepID=UPI002010CB58|nr:hypothetical protein [Argonema antarcticum]MCL1469391.1 hypothetical protein [Argonema antarcticum A004/B2]